MRTVRTKVYKFDELSEQAQQKAVDSYIAQYGIETDFIYDEAHETVKAFHEAFGTKENRRSWLECDCSNIENDVLELKGLRLRTYIINNFWDNLFKGKYFSLWSKTEVSFKYHKEGYPVLKSRHSKVLFDNTCTLTGVCYDMSLLQPIYDFIEYKDKPDYYSYMDFETLMNDCFASLEKDIDSEVEAQSSFEVVSEQLRSNDSEFTKQGNLFI